jgi:hypothetical protein
VVPGELPLGFELGLPSKLPTEIQNDSNLVVHLLSAIS